MMGALETAMERGLANHSQGDYPGIPAECLDPGRCVARRVLPEMCCADEIPKDEFFALKNSIRVQCGLPCSENPDEYLRLSPEAVAEMRGALIEQSRGCDDTASVPATPVSG